MAALNSGNTISTTDGIKTVNENIRTNIPYDLEQQMIVQGLAQEAVQQTINLGSTHYSAFLNSPAGRYIEGSSELTKLSANLIASLNEVGAACLISRQAIETLGLGQNSEQLISIISGLISSQNPNDAELLAKLVFGESKAEKAKNGKNRREGAHTRYKLMLANSNTATSGNTQTAVANRVHGLISKDSNQALDRAKTLSKAGVITEQSVTNSTLADSLRSLSAVEFADRFIGYLKSRNINQIDNYDALRSSIITDPKKREEATINYVQALLEEVKDSPRAAEQIKDIIALDRTSPEWVVAKVLEATNLIGESLLVILSTIEQPLRAEVEETISMALRNEATSNIPVVGLIQEQGPKLAISLGEQTAEAISQLTQNHDANYLLSEPLIYKNLIEAIVEIHNLIGEMRSKESVNAKKKEEAQTTEDKRIKELSIRAISYVLQLIGSRSLNSPEVLALMNQARISNPYALGTDRLTAVQVEAALSLSRAS